MSRIEKAIEIAARKRTAIDPQADATTVASPPQIPATVSLGAPPAASESVPLSSPAARRAEQPRRQVVLPLGTNPCLVMANAVDSPAAEQYRKLKSNIMKQFRAGQKKQSLMVTSPMGGGSKARPVRLAVSSGFAGSVPATCRMACLAPVAVGVKVT